MSLWSPHRRPDFEPSLGRNVWLIPYRKNVAGVSVAQPFLQSARGRAAGRPRLRARGRSGAHRDGKQSWLGGDPGQVGSIGRGDPGRGWVVRCIDGWHRVVAAAGNFSPDRALTSYATLVHELLQNPE